MRNPGSGVGGCPSSEGAGSGAEEEASVGRITVAPMTDRDVPGVAEVDADCFPTHWDVQSYRNELENRAARYMVARYDDFVVGFGGMWLVGDEAHITMLGVRRQYRRRGIGAKLLASLLLEARRLGVQRATLEVRESNAAAIALYESFGFEVKGVRPNYYETEDAKIMWAEDLLSDWMSERLSSVLCGCDECASPSAAEDTDSSRPQP